MNWENTRSRQMQSKNECLKNGRDTKLVRGHVGKTTGHLEKKHARKTPEAYTVLPLLFKTTGWRGRDGNTRFAFFM
jgi:hypothetical protein